MSDLLEGYLSERADFDRVLAGIAAIDAAGQSQLESVEWLTNVIRDVGLVPVPEAEKTYGPDAEFLNASQQGLIQVPREFARYLNFVGQQRPASYLEIGCFNGATACVATAYLRRFHPNFQAVTVDVFPAFVFYPEVASRLPLTYEVGKTSADFRNRDFDAVFIDGDHSFEWAWADYQHCGKSARICALHDVNNAPYRELHMGGVPAVWELIKQAEPEAVIEEIFDHPNGEEYMGIGVRLRS